MVVLGHPRKYLSASSASQSVSCPSPPGHFYPTAWTPTLALGLEGLLYPQMAPSNSPLTPSPYLEPRLPEPRSVVGL